MNPWERIGEELLPCVRSPGQSIGGEIDQLVAAGDWAAADVCVAVAFADTYTLGMSHLGCRILYRLRDRQQRARVRSFILATGGRPVYTAGMLLPWRWRPLVCVLAGCRGSAARAA
ncbi:MAG: hypothetical protein JXA69_14840 [Phycisphaerae bacterium]|nr:hypothetical protein [Phycisphaerae bacterium]